ncbi:HAD family hydrolase [Gulosibacter chungangensis]|uniref:HAD family phosphatase n=1 Tax=Gulosibacter chungangensis TaxID=979746 RepID=A0A7J5BD93_9MICO|nr:HAD family phosphatase [Gulosibacter chungangensis]KAB1644151.1 HAD family phosphatase [Gulosibacter chungangensis]
MTANTPAAVLWDMDGTLVETERYWIMAQSGLMVRHGLPPLTPEQDEALVGSSLQSAAAMFRDLGVPLSIPEIMDTVSNEVIELVGNGVSLRPGALELLNDLHKHEIPTAIVTNSGRDLVDAVLPHLGGHEFSQIVTFEDVEHGKPHPEGYLLAAEKLGVASEHCIVLEDSVNGLGGAIAAGSVPIGIPFELDLQPNESFIRLETLAGIGWRDLQSLFAEFRNATARR